MSGGRPREGWSAFGEAGLEGRGSGVVCQQQMFDDLLDRPGGRIAFEAELSLGRIKSA